LQVLLAVMLTLAAAYPDGRDHDYNNGVENQDDDNSYYDEEEEDDDPTKVKDTPTTLASKITSTVNSRVPSRVNSRVNSMDSMLKTGPTSTMMKLRKGEPTLGDVSSAFLM
jgi:hypothetical protein